jgi:hypothetical protein
VFLSLGGALDTLHGFKDGVVCRCWKRNAATHVHTCPRRRTLLALINIAAGLTVRKVDRFELRPSVSFALIWAAILLPAGFFLGGIVTYDGDPGLGVWLVPVGAILLFYSVARIALDLSKLK